MQVFGERASQTATLEGGHDGQSEARFGVAFVPSAEHAVSRRSAVEVGHAIIVPSGIGGAALSFGGIEWMRMEVLSLLVGGDRRKKGRQVGLVSGAHHFETQGAGYYHWRKWPRMASAIERTSSSDIPGQLGRLMPRWPRSIARARPVWPAAYIGIVCTG